MKKLLVILAATLGLSGLVGLAHAVCDSRSTTCLTTLDVAGNATVGSLTNTGSSTITGNQTLTGNLSVTGSTTLSTTTVSGGPTTLSTTTYNGGVVLWSRTLAQINSLTSGTTGQMLLCSDCTRSTICVSSGTVGAGAWVIAVATGTFAGSTFSGLQHCQ